MFSSKKSQKALSSLIAMTFIFSVPLYGTMSMSSIKKAEAETIYTPINDGQYGANAGGTVNGINPNGASKGPTYTIPTGEKYTFGKSASETAQMDFDDIQKIATEHDSAEMGKKANNNVWAAAGIDLIGGGIPISGNVRYAYVSSDGYSGRATSVCLPGNSEARHVAVNDEAKYNCYTWVSGGYAMPPVAQITVSPKKSGKGSEQISVPYVWYEKVQTNNGVRHIKHQGTQAISITYNAYEAKNTMEDSLAGISAPKVDIIPTDDETGDGKVIGGGGSSECADGTSVCYDVGTINLPGENGSDGGDGSDGSNGINGTNGSSGSDGRSYSDLLNDLLNDSNSYNSGDSDWAKSNNGDGSANLDEYFNGLGDDDSLPTGLTDDVLGVDGDLDALGLSGEDTDGDGVLDTFTDVNGNTMNADEVATYMENMQNGDSDTDGFYSGDADDTDGVGGQSFNDFLSQFGLDGLGDGTLGSLTDENGNDSLAKRISDYISSKATGAEAGDKYTISEQEMYDLAKKMLLANGMSLDDIKKGKNYDKNSAYTEPATAWNMNRITTLLKDKKIKLESKDEVKKEKNNNVLTKASEKDKQIKSQNEKKTDSK